MKTIESHLALGWLYWFPWGSKWESEFSGLDWSTGLEQLTTGMEYWNTGMENWNRTMDYWNGILDNWNRILGCVARDSVYHSAHTPRSITLLKKAASD